MRVTRLIIEGRYPHAVFPKDHLIMLSFRTLWLQRGPVREGRRVVRGGHRTVFVCYINHMINKQWESRKKNKLFFLKRILFQLFDFLNCEECRCSYLYLVEPCLWRTKAVLSSSISEFYSFVFDLFFILMFDTSFAERPLAARSLPILHFSVSDSHSRTTTWLFFSSLQLKSVILVLLLSPNQHLR